MGPFAHHGPTPRRLLIDGSRPRSLALTRQAAFYWATMPKWELRGFGAGSGFSTLRAIVPVDNYLVIISFGFLFAQELQ